MARNMPNFAFDIQLLKKHLRKHTNSIVLPNGGFCMSQAQASDGTVGWPIRVCVAIFCFVLGIGLVLGFFPDAKGASALLVFGATVYFLTKLYRLVIRKAAVARGISLFMCVPLLGLCVAEEIEPFKELSANEFEPSELENSYSVTSLPATHDYSRFVSCFEVLYSTDDGFTRKRSEYEKVLSMLSRDVGPESAHDIAAEASIRACRKHARKPVDHLPSFYTRVAQNRMKTFIRKNSFLCALDDFDDTYSTNPVQEIELNRAWCALREDEQEILRLRSLGYVDQELAEVLQITPVAARKRLERARKAFLNNRN